VPNSELSKADRAHESRKQAARPPDGREFGTYASKIGLHFGEIGFRGEFGPASAGHTASHVQDGNGGRFVEAGVGRCGNFRVKAYCNGFQSTIVRTSCGTVAAR